MSNDEKIPRGLLISRDLFFSSRIAGAARAAGWEFHTLMVRESILAALRAGGLRLVLVELDATDLTPEELLAGFPEKTSGPEESRPRFIGFGPHVQAGLLEAARTAGFDAVLTNGQLTSQLPELFHLRNR